MALVMDTDRIPVLGETKMAHNYRKAFGGKGSNQAVQAARLGADVMMVSKIGKDADGQDCLDLYKSEHIDSSYMFIDGKMPTATGFIICSEDGHNIISIDIAALNNLTCDEIDKAMEEVNAGDIVVLQFEINPEVTLHSARKAKEKGAVVIMNPAPAIDLRGIDLSCVDYLTPNETEARVSLGLDSRADANEAELAKELHKSGCKNVIVTMGAAGSILYDGTDISEFSSYKISAMDSTGAGDAFNAGLAVALLEKRNIAEAIGFAGAVGARSCLAKDTIPSYGYRKDIEEFISLSEQS